jgi:hypothetical protein
MRVVLDFIGRPCIISLWVNESLSMITMVLNAATKVNILMTRFKKGGLFYQSDYPEFTVVFCIIIF